MTTRDQFHVWLVTQGYRADIKPMTPDGTYASSHAHQLWECWQAAIQSTYVDQKDAIWQAPVDALGEST